MNSAHLSHPKYRPDIDGLRALAVLSVVGFHAFPSWIKGGFIGVDVFFVISGFLISSIIFENLKQGTFSLAGFYARRIKRIFPALLIVLIASYAFGWFALLSDEYKQLGKHVAGGAGFVSNFVLWNEAGYFDQSAETKPLLHLWSLGIEEQFYIIWPVLLWLAWNRKFHFLTITLSIALVSFVLNVKGVHKDGVATFYSPQTRFWELLCGSTLAWITLYEKGRFSPISARLDEWLASTPLKGKSLGDGKTAPTAISCLGLFLLLFGLLEIQKNYSFPGLWAVIPVLGAVLIILAGPKAWINRTILSNKIVVWFGLISFPLYLWHWPLLSFARVVESETPNRNIRAIAVLLSIALAWLTYRVIERPIRSGKRSNTKVTALSLSMAIVACLGFSSYKLDQFRPARMAPENNFNSFIASHRDFGENCKREFRDQKLVEGCLLQRESGNTVALVGDSHAGQLFVGLSEEASSSEGVALFNYACQPPFVDVSIKSSDNPNIRRDNYKLMNKALDFILQQSTIKTVILAHHPQCSYNNAIDERNLDITNSRRVLTAGLLRTISLLTGAQKKVVVVLDNPFLPFEPNACTDRPFRLLTKSSQCTLSRKTFDEDLALAEYREIVGDALRAFPQIVVTDLSNYLCDRKSCYLNKDGRLLYADRGHLSNTGSRYVAPFIFKSIRNQGGEGPWEIGQRDK
jgi:peptidoglycan/LPS O-acetylase OafA/YrhL